MICERLDRSITRQKGWAAGKTCVQDARQAQNVVSMLVGEPDGAQSIHLHSHTRLRGAPGEFGSFCGQRSHGLTANVALRHAQSAACQA